MRLEDAKRAGAIALFGEKYGESVRVVRIGEFSKELCGGTHLTHGGAIGGFAIVSEGSIGAGLRRMEAVTGREAQAFLRRQRELVSDAAKLLKARPEEVGSRIVQLQGQAQAHSSASLRLTVVNAKQIAADLVHQAEEIGGVKLVAARVPQTPHQVLSRIADEVLAGLASGIVMLGTEEEPGHVHFVSKVSSDLVDKGYHAGNLIREVAKVAGGGGGGRPDFAQAGGKNPERLDEALAKAKELLAGRNG
jgi:alanyl-tRNA synthetase